MILNAYFQCLKLFDSIDGISKLMKSAVLMTLFLFLLHHNSSAQAYQQTVHHAFQYTGSESDPIGKTGESSLPSVFSLKSESLKKDFSYKQTYRFSRALMSTRKDTVPEPLRVMYKSMMIPGWGQAVNKQYWKIPIIYAALGGVIGYTFYLDGKYDDYRAAYYNSFANPDQGTYTDQKFGPTPGYLENVVASQLRHNRNYYRNTRDLMVVMTGLAYGLNILDAYIFAHLRDFDVSDDLSINAGSSVNGNYSTITLTFNF